MLVHVGLSGAKSCSSGSVPCPQPLTASLIPLAKTCRALPPIHPSPMRPRAAERAALRVCDALGPARQPARRMMKAR